MGGITLAGRRWGPSVAGWLSAFPVVTAPILFFVSLEQGVAFGAQAAAATVSAIFAHMAFGLGYAWCGVRASWPVSLLAGLVGYGLSLMLVGAWAPSLAAALMGVLPVLLVARRCYPKALLATAGEVALPKSVAWPGVEIVMRMVAGACLVMVVTLSAQGLGPHWAGLLSMFPVMGVVLAVFSHRQSGAAFTVHLLRNMVWGYFAFATFCTSLALGMSAWGLWPGFALAVALSLAVQGLTLALMRRAG